MTSAEKARKAIYQEIEQERIRQDAFHGQPRPDQHRHGHYTWNAILGEETGEVSRALLEDDIPALRKELIQTAAVITAWVELIDQADPPAPNEPKSTKTQTP